VLAAGGLALACLAAPDARALIFAGAETEPTEAVPPDFPYWEHVTQRRYEGPTVIYLGAGWALTARHVGPGEIFLGGEVIAPEPRARHTVLNVDGSIADALLFELDREAALPDLPLVPIDLPLVPIAKSPPTPGEEVMLIGFGRVREKSVEWIEAPPGDGDTVGIGFQWSTHGRKRWGTNRVLHSGEWLAQGSWLTRALVFRFDDRSEPDSTPYEAHAALGDSGGAVFVRREHGWELAGLMVSITGSALAPPHTSRIGDLTYAADLSSYRSEILRWARPACANEEDDDGDGRIDFPEDPDCKAETDRDERRSPKSWLSPFWAGGIALGLLGVGIVARARRRAQRGRSTPRSISPSSAA
jgi:hypothetical protein